MPAWTKLPESCASTYNGNMERGNTILSNLLLFFISVRTGAFPLPLPGRSLCPTLNDWIPIGFPLSFSSYFVLFSCLFHSFFLFERNFDILSVLRLPVWRGLGRGCSVNCGLFFFPFSFFFPPLFKYLFINNRAACSGLRRSYFFLSFFFLLLFLSPAVLSLSFLLAVSSRRFFFFLGVFAI